MPTPPKRILVPIVAVVLTAAVILWFVGRRDRTNSRYLPVSGTVEITQVELGFKISGRLAERPADEGRPVAAGEVVASLDAQDQKLKVALAEAESHAARARLQELENGSRPEEIAQAHAQLQQANAAARTAQSRFKLAGEDLRRFMLLLQEHVISQRDFDTLHTAYEAALNADAEAQARIRLAQAQLALVKIGPRAEVIEQARARLASAEQNLALAKRQLEDTRLTAPMNGVVLSTPAEPGAYVNPGTPVLTIGQIDDLWLRAYVNETDIGRVKLDQKAIVRTDSHPGKEYIGRISYISDEAEFTPKSVQTHEERVKLIYRIKIALHNPLHELKPGMPADASIDLRP